MNQTTRITCKTLLLVSLFAASCFSCMGVSAKIIPISGSAEYADWVRVYLEQYHGSQATIEDKRSDFEHFGNFIGDTPLLALTAKDVRRFADQHMLSYAPNTVNRRLATIRTFVKWAARRGGLSEDFSPDIKSLDAPEWEPRFLTASQIEKVSTAIETDPNVAVRNNLIVEILRGTGLRRAEIPNLNYSQWDKKEGLFRNVLRKRRKHQNIFIEGEQFQTALNEYDGVRSKLLRAWEGEHGALNNPARNRLPLLLSFHSPRKFDSESFRMSDETIRKAIQKRAGKDVHLHLFRHQFAKEMLDATGGDVRTVMQAMGHSDVNTTMRYLTETEDKIRAAMRKRA